MPLVAIAMVVVIAMCQSNVLPYDDIPGFGYTMIATQGTYGIIIDARFAEPFVYTHEGQTLETWTPTREDVSAAESLLRPHRPGDTLDAGARQDYGSPGEAVSRTWYGAIVEGERLLYVNGYCSGGLPANPLTPVIVADGGPCYWNATIDTDAWEIVSYVENGEA